MNKDDYFSKIHDILPDGNYEVVKNPTMRITKRVNDLIKSSTLPSKWLRTTNSDPNCPLWAAKNTQVGVLLRPFVSSIN